MPIGEFIGEVLLRGFLEVILYGLSYCTGACVLSLVTLGQLNLAPLHTIEERNRREKWRDWSFWLHRPMQGRALKAECVCLVGLLSWIAIGIIIYAVNRAPVPPKADSLLKSGVGHHHRADCSIDGGKPVRNAPR